MSLSEIYEYLENNVKILNRLYHFTQFINSNNKDYLSAEEKLNLEIEGTIFSISEHIKTKRLDWMDKAYSIISQDYKYIESRINQTSNVLLKAIYSEILYYSNEVQYKKYIQFAVKYYFDILQELVKDFSANSTDDYVHSGIDIFEKLLHLAVISKSSQLKNIKNFVLKLLQIESNITLYHFLIVTIISEMLEYNKTFKKSDFAGVDDILWNLANLKFKEGEYLYVISIVSQHAHKIDKKIGKLSYCWDDLIGKAYEKLIQKADSALTARYWCIYAIKHYTRLNKYSNKIQKLEIEYSKFKNKLELSTFKQQINYEPFIDIAEDILKLSPIDILKHLACSPIYFPPLDNLNTQDNYIADFFPTSYLDENMHPAKISDMKTEQDLYLTNYQNFWQIYEITVQHIIIEGVRNKKITEQALANFLMDYSSFFDITIKSYPNKKRIRYNWSSTILSIFETYFNEINKSFSEPKIYYPNLITVTESFVLKFETWIRYYLACHNQPTISSLPQENGIIREKDLNYLLYDDFIIEKFDFNDLLYFRYLFIAKEGCNLRNEIAHGCLIPEQYTVELFNRVFFAFLRLAKYIFPTAERNRFKKPKKQFTYKQSN